ncbi:transcriptional adapter 1-like isoform X2 [Clavelina lepadiformis]
MKAWFKQYLTKEEFDFEARKLLTKDHVHLHNKFLLAVITKCNISGSLGPSKDYSSLQVANKAKRNRKQHAIKRKFEHRWGTNQLVDTAQMKEDLRVQKKATWNLQQPIKMCSKSLQIPSVEEMSRFVSVISWELGLDDATDDAIALATDAVHIFIKNLLSAIFSKRSTYETYNHHFKYSMGCDAENPYLLQRKPVEVPTVRPTYEKAMQKDIEKVGRSFQNQCQYDKMPVNMFDLLYTLKTSPAIIASNTVFSQATQRVTAELWHPSEEELQQDRIFANIS